MTKKILVTSHGEIAMRISRTCRMMNISTVAVYASVDRGVLYVRYAEGVYCIPSSPEDTSYLRPELALPVTKKIGTAIHPGHGFLPENADFARRYEGERVTFTGPGVNIIAKMRVRAEACRIMHEVELPIVPGMGIPAQGIEEMRKVAEEVGYPIMLKVLAGGDGKGMRLVRPEEEAETALRLSQFGASTSFGNNAVYMGEYVENPHHIEVQIMGNKYNNVVHLSEHECSVQRRNQRVIEEPPSPFVEDEAHEKMLKIAIEACKRVGCYSTDTLGFTVDRDQDFYFLEMNIHLQVEHPVTEECTGVNLVHDMITVATGNSPPHKRENIKFSGTAIECHIYAEDPENSFMPSPGVITVHEASEGRNLRLDGAAYAEFEVSLRYDPMVAKLCCWGRICELVVSDMTRTLREYKILGIRIATPFHQRVLKSAAPFKGKYDTTFIDTRFNKEDLKCRQNTDPTVAVIAAAVRHYEREKETASRATALPIMGGSLREYYDKLQMTANNY